MAPSTLALLLRFMSSLTPSVDPLEGLSAGDRRRAMDQLQEIIAESDWTIGQDVKTALRQATILLSSTTTSLGLIDTLEALGHLNTACRLLAASSFPRRSPALPLELISHIIDLAQHPTDFHERQQTNITLSYVSRDVHSLVRPILRREIHITRTWQLSRLDKVCTDDYDRAKEVRVVSAVLNPVELRRQSDTVWHGRFLPGLIGWLASGAKYSAPGESTALHLHMTSYPQEEEPWLPLAVGDPNHSLNWIYDSGDKMQELYFHHDVNYEVDRNDYDMYYAILGLSTRIKRFHISLPGPCREWRDVYDEEGAPRDLMLEPRALERFSAEHAAFYPSDLLSLLPNNPPVLHTLKVTLVLPSRSHSTSSSERAAFAELFTRLAPSLRNLTLRIRNYDESLQGEVAVTDLVAAAVLALPHLRILTLGGTAVGRDLPERFAYSDNIKDFTILPSCHFTVHTSPAQLISHQGLLHPSKPADRFPNLDRLTLWMAEDDIPSAMLMNLGEDAGMEVRFRTAPRNWAEFHMSER